MFYVTTYCNHPHRIKDGKPIGHECHILPPKALAAEIAGDYALAQQLIQAGKTHFQWGERSLPSHRGLKAI